MSIFIFIVAVTFRVVNSRYDHEIKSIETVIHVLIDVFFPSLKTLRFCCLSSIHRCQNEWVEWLELRPELWQSAAWQTNQRDLSRRDFKLRMYAWTSSLSILTITPRSTLIVTTDVSTSSVEWLFAECSLAKLSFECLRNFYCGYIKKNNWSVRLYIHAMLLR